MQRMRRLLSMRKSLRIVLQCTGLGLMLLSPPPSQAIFGVGDIVYDINNHMTNILTQANTLKSTVNEGIMISNQAQALKYQVQSLLNEAMNLQKNPLRLLSQLEGLWGAYNGIMANADGLAFNLIGTAAKFEAKYPQVHLPGVDNIVKESAAMLESIRSASKTAVSVQSIYTRLCDQLDGTKKALTTAEAAQGALQIGQAQAQLQGVNNELLASIAQLTAANGRVQTELASQQVVQQEMAQVENAAWIEGFGSQGFAQPGMGGGVELK